MADAAVARCMKQRQVMDPRSKSIIRGLLDPGGDLASVWSASDCAAMMEHLMETPLLAESDRFAELAGTVMQRIDELIKATGNQTFYELLSSGRASLMLLTMVKDYAKVACATGEDLPPDVGRVLYVASILAAMRRGDCITTLSAAAVEKERRRCLTLIWLPDRVRSLLANWGEERHLRIQE